MTLIIAGERSGVGKTTVTLALLSFLCWQQKLSVRSFKVGPDYIDPMFHQYVTKSPCRNLDPVLTSEPYVQQCFHRHVQQSEYALVEGVMGLFDGIGNREVKSQKSKACPRAKRRVKSQKSQLPTNNYQLPINFASTAHIARLLDLPVLLVIDCSRLSGSVAAIAHGYRSFDPSIKIVGLVLNRVGSDRHLQLLQDAIASLDLPILGVLRRHDNITIPDRHLGLVPTAELPQLNSVIEQLATLAETCFDWDKLMSLMRGSRDKRAEESEGATANYQLPITNYQLPIKIAIARDRAFNFYYQDNLDLLQQLGAELVFWSPLDDPGLPENVSGLYFGGGFPEVFAPELAANTGAIASVKAAILTGMPTYAECGGLMYLCEKILDFDRNSWSMVGVIPTTSVMGSRLTLGYRHCIVLQDSPLLQTGDAVWGHEFHRSSIVSPIPENLADLNALQVSENGEDLKAPQVSGDEGDEKDLKAPLYKGGWGDLPESPNQPLFQTQGFNTVPTPEGWRLPHLHASYIHLHFGTRPDIPARFLQQCACWKQRVGNLN